MRARGFGASASRGDHSCLATVSAAPWGAARRSLRPPRCDGMAAGPMRKSAVSIPAALPDWLIMNILYNRSGGTTSKAPCEPHRGPYRNACRGARNTRCDDQIQPRTRPHKAIATATARDAHEKLSARPGAAAAGCCLAACRRRGLLSLTSPEGMGPGGNAVAKRCRLAPAMAGDVVRRRAAQGDAAERPLPVPRRMRGDYAADIPCRPIAGALEWAAARPRAAACGSRPA